MAKHGSAPKGTTAGDQNKAATPAPNQTHATPAAEGPADATPRQQHGPAMTPGQVGTLPGTAGVQGADANRYDPMQASGAEPPLGSGRNSGQSAESVGAAPGGSQQAGPYSGAAGEMSPQRQAEQAASRKGGGGVRLGSSESGDDVTLKHAAAELRSTTDALNGKDFWAACEHAGKLLSLAGRCGTTQHPTTAQHRAMAGQPRPDADAVKAEHGEWDRATQEFQKAKGAAVEFAPQMHNAEWHRSGGPASGAAQPLAPKQAGVSLDPSSLMTILEVIQRVVDLINLFRNR
jgi:hypothetical protein